MLSPVSHHQHFDTGGQAVKLKLVYINWTLLFRVETTSRWRPSEVELPTWNEKAVARYRLETSPALAALHAEWVSHSGGSVNTCPIHRSVNIFTISLIVSAKEDGGKLFIRRLEHLARQHLTCHRCIRLLSSVKMYRCSPIHHGEKS